MNCRVNIAAVVSGDIGISYCQEVSTAGRKHRHSVSVNTGWGLKQLHRKRLPYGSLFFLQKFFLIAIWHNKSVDRSLSSLFLKKIRYVVLPEPREQKSQIWQQPPVLYLITSRYKPGFFIAKKMLLRISYYRIRFFLYNAKNLL